ncbi:MAG: hypothetical protein AB7O97_06665 [Planctomycetota bacterium]
MLPSRPSLASLVVAVALVVGAGLNAQDKPAGGVRPGKGGVQMIDAEAAEKQAMEDGTPGGESKGGFTLDKPSEVREMGARGRCRFDGSFQPKRLMPTQTGKLLVTMVLQADAVMAAPASVQVTSLGNSVTIGAVRVSPPTNGTVAEAYLGKPVYDNWALLEIDVTMPPDAKLGEKRTAVLQIEFDLNEGATGKPLGHFRERVSYACEVGVDANPVVTIAPQRADPVTPTQVEEPAPARQQASGDEVGGAESSDPTPSGHVAEAPASAAGPSEATGRMPQGNQPPVDASSPTAWLALGGGLVVLLGGALLLSRRK